MKAILESQADRIETVLALYKVSARVTGGTVTPRHVRFQVLPVMGAKISEIRMLSGELATALDTSSCRVSRRGAAVDIEVPRDDPCPVRLLPLYCQLTRTSEPSHARTPPIPPATAILGLAEDGAPLLIRLPSPDVGHILVLGQDGCGKTSLLHTVALSLALANDPQGVALVLLGAALAEVAALPHANGGCVAVSDSEKLSMLDSLRKTVAERLKWQEKATAAMSAILPSSATISRGPSAVVLIDDFADVVLAADQQERETITYLLTHGRTAGVHLICASKNTALMSASLLLGHFPVRIVGRVATAEQAQATTGYKASGAQLLESPGDFLAIAEGRSTRFVSAFPDVPAACKLVTGRRAESST